MSTTTSQLLLALLPVALLVLQATLNVPQLVKLFRRQHGGVPLSGEALTLVAGVGWLVLSLSVGDHAMALSSLLTLVGFGPSTWLLVRAGLPWRSAAGLVALVVALTSGAWLVDGVSGLSAALLALALVQYGAYLLAAVRCDDWSGFSPAAGTMRVLFGIGWGVHALTIDNPTVLVWSVLTALTFSATLTRAMLWRRRAAAVPATAVPAYATAA